MSDEKNMSIKENKAAFAAALVHWFKREGRSLPWRDTDDPYFILVSEVMLQQTRVTTVIPYYFRFIETLPDFAALANCPEDELHRLWEGLGYYSRVNRLQLFARKLLEEKGGVIPREPEELMKMPGIGSYTAGALLSFAYHVKVPAVDGNVRRVIARLTADEREIGEGKVIKDFEQFVRELLPEEVYEFNQGLIELGALVCTPKNPKCAECPLQAYCEGYQKEMVHLLPNKKKKVKPVSEPMLVLLMESQGRYLFVKRPEGGLLGGLWGLPIIPLEEGQEDQSVLAEYFRREFAWKGDLIELFERATYQRSVDHIFSHRRWEQRIYKITMTEEEANKVEKSLALVDFPKTKLVGKKDISLPTAFRKCFE